MATILLKSLAIIVTLMLVLALVLFARKHVLKHLFVDKNNVSEQRYLNLGGVKQWVDIRGHSTHNPILIFLHGGPGISLHGPFRYFHHDLEKHFTLVGWDQRGAGKSQSNAIPPASMTINNFVSDLHELVSYLKKRFQQNNVYILGESWGSLLGITYAHRYPEDVKAYIGTGQISNMQESERLGYEFMLVQAKKRNNQEALAELQSITQPPYSVFKDISVLRKWLLLLGGCHYQQTSYDPLLKKLAADKDAMPDFSGVAFSLPLLYKELFQKNLFTQIPELHVPVYFLEGRHDYQVSSKLAVKYFDYIKAPKKELMWFESSGHNPMFEEPELFSQALLHIRYQFAFNPVEEKDLPLLYAWFKQPHVEQWWPVPTEQEDFFNSFLKRIRSDTKPYLVLCNDMPIGYIQCYSVDQTTSTWLPKLSGNIIGIDQFIGEPDYLGRGIGTLFIKKFIKNLVTQDQTLSIIVDPDPTNTIAIKCYEKVGFKKLGTYQAPWGPALLMIYKLQAKS